MGEGDYETWSHTAKPYFWVLINFHASKDINFSITYQPTPNLTFWSMRILSEIDLYFQIFVPKCPIGGKGDDRAKSKRLNFLCPYQPKRIMDEIWDIAEFNLSWGWVAHWNGNNTELSLNFWVEAGLRFCKIFVCHLMSKGVKSSLCVLWNVRVQQICSFLSLIG